MSKELVIQRMAEEISKDTGFTVEASVAFAERIINKLEQSGLFVQTVVLPEMVRINCLDMAGIPVD